MQLNSTQVCRHFCWHRVCYFPVIMESSTYSCIHIHTFVGYCVCCVLYFEPPVHGGLTCQMSGLLKLSLHHYCYRTLNADMKDQRPHSFSHHRYCHWKVNSKIMTVHFQFSISPTPNSPSPSPFSSRDYVLLYLTKYWQPAKLRAKMSSR